MRKPVCSAKAKAVGLLILLLLIGPIVSATSCTPGRTQLKVICAGSLIVPFQEMEKEFEAVHPDIDVVVEGHGSIQVIRYVTELATEADVVAVADYSLIPMMMYDNQVPGTSQSYADWYVKFATNRLGLAYTNKSKYADRINATNWYDILSGTDIKVGVPNPLIDSCGYRALMMCQLAEAYYGDETIFESVMGSFSPPVTVSDNIDTHVISVPEVLKATKVTIRGSSVVLLGLLESGDLDYSFEYESVAMQRGLGFVELPPEIDLSSQNFADVYSHVMVRLDFQRFASVIPEFRGEPIVYALTIPSNSSHPEAAAEFVEFLLGTGGQRVLSEDYQPTLVPAEVDNPANLTSRLRTLLAEQ